MSRRSYTLTSWLWLPANISNLLVSNHKPSWCWLGIPKPTSIVFTKLPGTKISVAVIFTSLLSRYVIKTSWIMFLLCIYCETVHSLSYTAILKKKNQCLNFARENCGFGYWSCIYSAKRKKWKHNFLFENIASSDLKKQIKTDLRFCKIYFIAG